MLAAAAAAFGFLSTTADGRARIVSRIMSSVPTLTTSVAEQPTAAPAPLPAPAPATPPPALAQREPSVSVPPTVSPRRVPQAAPAAVAPARTDPSPPLPPATLPPAPTARPDSASKVSGPPASRREAPAALPPTMASRREAPTPVPSTAATRRDPTSSNGTAADAARRETATAPTAPRRTARNSGPPRVELDARPEGAEAERTIVYTVRLSDSSGRPLDDAAVTLHGWLPNGSDLATSLQSTATPGTYRGSVQVGQRTPTNLRVRVMHEGLRFQVPSGR